MFEYIECFYNRQRRHSSLGYLSPTHYEELMTQPPICPVHKSGSSSESEEVGTPSRGAMSTPEGLKE
ncbi:IS3 family transposase [Dictyobacter vulcani]|uniref:IS3 family transposase n=1 Tax=Dictyobacter vulcani TaxID=2607529 RepID=UPI001250AFB4